MMKKITGILLLIAIFMQCSPGEMNQKPAISEDETSLETALSNWPEMPQQITFIGLKDCPTKFQVYWNGAISCFVGRDCFGYIFPPQEAITRKYEKEKRFCRH